MSTIKNRKRIFILFLIFSPLIWWLLFQFDTVLLDWMKVPGHIKIKILGFFNEERVVKVGLMRWSNIDTGYQAVLSKVFYNKITLIIPEIFSFLSFLSPRIFFQAGDGSNYSPPGVEPMPILLFPFFIYGIYLLVKSNKFKTFKFLGLFGFIGYLTDIRSVAYLFPVALVYLYISACGFEGLPNRYKNKTLIIIGAYSLYILSRTIWIKY